MEKKDLIMNALQSGNNAARLYAGLHDLNVETSSSSYGFSVKVGFYPRDKKNELKRDENGELVYHHWEFNEWDNLENLQDEFCKMNKFLNNPKNF